MLGRRGGSWFCTRLLIASAFSTTTSRFSIYSFFGSRMLWFRCLGGSYSVRVLIKPSVATPGSWGRRRSAAASSPRAAATPIFSNILLLGNEECTRKCYLVDPRPLLPEEPGRAPSPPSNTPSA